MTTDASHDVEGIDEDGAEEQRTDAMRPSLADWLVGSVRGGQAGAPEALATAMETPAPDPEALTATRIPECESIHEAHPEGAESEDDAVRTDFNVGDDGSEVDSSRTLMPQIFSEDDLDEELSVVLPTPAQRARRAMLVRVAILTLGAVALSFLGRWISRGRANPATAQPSVIRAVTAPAPFHQPTAPIAPGDDTSVDSDEDEQRSDPSRSISGGVESTGRVARTSPTDSASSGPPLAPASSVARFPDLPRDVLRACEQAALQAHSAAPTPEATPPSE
jgi:hypothetical protein